MDFRQHIVEVRSRADHRYIVEFVGGRIASLGFPAGPRDVRAR
jgi:hypothetical protein